MSRKSSSNGINNINNSYQMADDNEFKIIREKFKSTDIELRKEILQKIIDKKITVSAASIELGLTARQVYNLLKRYKEDGENGLYHELLGRKSNYQKKKEMVERARKLIHIERLEGCKPTYITEKLNEVYGINISRETVRKLMIEEKLWNTKTKRLGIYRTRRARRSYYGELSQFDGSYHRRFELNETKYCLLLDVDDATGRIMYAKLGNNEGYEEVAKFWMERIRKHGAPRAIYLDGFSTYKISTSSNATKNDDFRKKFDHSLRKLGCQLITAKTPWAKGRVERYNGILQNRLVKDLKFYGIKDINTANYFIENIFIPKYNEKFAVEPALPEDVHIKLAEKELSEIKRLFAVEAERSLGFDYVIQYKGVFYQLKNRKERQLYPKKRLLISESLDGEIRIHCNSHYESQSVEYKIANKVDIQNSRSIFYMEKKRKEQLLNDERRRQREDERFKISKERKYYNQAQRLINKKKMREIAEGLDEVTGTVEIS